MKLIVTLLSLVLATSVFAREYCERPAEIEADSAVPLLGRYEIIGRLPDSDKSYGGYLEIMAGKTAYVLRRTVGGKVSRGEGWMEVCSADRFSVFRFRYPNASPASPTAPALQGQCYFRGNGDNYLLMSCYTTWLGQETHRRGLESMFQLEAP